MGGMGTVKTQPNLGSMVFPNSSSTMPGSPHASSLLNPNFFNPQLDFQCQGNKHQAFAGISCAS